MVTAAVTIRDQSVHPADLRYAEIFRELDDEELGRLARWFVELAVPADYYMIREGEVSEAFYVVRDGAVAVFEDAVGKPMQLLSRLHRGDFFGEMGLFGIGKRTASVRTTAPSRILKITKRDLLAFLDRRPAIKRKLLWSAARRYSAAMAATLELGRRREVRIRMDHEVELICGDEARQPVHLENLSLGGLCLSPAPESWQPGESVGFGLGLRHGDLELNGRVVWRLGDRAGVAFVKTFPNHDMLVQLTIRMLLESF